jgi:PAS domain S-box-containing protein
MAYEEERKRAQALEAIDKAKTIFFSNISHEFRTPLTLILGTLEESLKNDGGREQMENGGREQMENGGGREQMELMHRNAMRLLKLVNSLLDFSRIEDGRQKAVYALTDLGSLTANLAAHFRSLIEKAGLTLTVKTEGILQPVYVDKGMWEKIVFNLLSNAFKYTLKGGITLHLFFDGDHAVMTVEDTGTGIPETEMPRLFERFYRVENARGRSYEGTGIGLSLTRELVKLHGGEIRVRSKMGLGSTFEVRIPFGKGHLPPDQTADAPWDSEETIYHDYFEAPVPPDGAPALPDDAPGGSRETILVVDDNADMRAHIRSLLQKQFRVLTAANGMEALHKIRSEKPALVVSDIMMPIMDGIQLVREVKGNKTMAQTPVILLTARAGEESKVQGLGTGADDYLVKPFSATELVARIRAQLNIVRRKNEIEEDLRSFLMQAPAAIAIMDGPEHTFTLANALYRDMFGLDEDQLLGRTAREAFPQASLKSIEFLDIVYKTGEIITQRAYQGPGGYFDFTLKPLRNHKKEVTGVMCHVTNVTEKVQASERLEAEVALRTRELKQINEQLESFNYIASHDLQEPLRKIRTFIQLLEKHQDDPETWKKYASKIQESSRRMSYLIQSVLEYSRLTQAVEAFQLTDLNRILDDLRCDYELLIKEKEAVFLSDPLPMIPAIPTQMEQLFSNLLSNSLKFSREKPLIQVRSRNVSGATVPCLEAHRTYVEITFSDNGIGFEPQYRKKIFQLFQRLHHSSEYNGSGIGLSIANKIVENHKGIILAESEEGHGAAFTIWLPLLS